jgi:predicted RNA binding protein YcfA (HicA-like mRNA interferase family)
VKVPRDLSGAQLIKVLCRDWDYHTVHQEGSHVILQTETPGHQRLSVPNHNPLRVGTLNGILRAVAIHKRVDRQALLDSLR